MFQNSRLNDLLEYFLIHKKNIYSSELAKHFQISERTLRNNIHEINETLQEYNVQILLKRKEGYYLHADDVSSISVLEDIMGKREKYLDSADQRIRHLIIKLLYSDHYLSQDALADEVHVSINTIINYLRSIRDILSHYDLTLQNKANLGYLIKGDELKKRNCIINLITPSSQQYVLQFSNDQKTLLKHVNLETIRDIVIDFDRRYDLHFTDYNLKNLILHIALSISRVQAGKSLETYFTPQNQQLKALLNPLLAHIEIVFDVEFCIAEKNYIYSYYVSSTGVWNNQGNYCKYAQELVSKILNCIYEFYHIDIRTDAVILKDLNVHLQSILNARYYHQDKKNPLLETIRTTYILAYEITKTAVYQVFETEPLDLCEDEIGYIALHIGAAIERYFDAHDVSKKKVLVVYGNGYAEGSFLAAKLSTLFKDTLTIIGSLPSHELNDINFSNIDLIISTVPVKYFEKVPVIVVEIPLGKKDIENITKTILKENIHPISTITDLFSPSLFIRTTAKSRDEIIHILCTLLKEEGCIMDNFEQSVLKREAKISTAMDGVIALPHPLIMSSSKSRIAVSILENPVKWSKKDNAQIILMLALADDRKRDTRTLYDTLAIITNNPSLESLLLQSNSIQEFLQIMKNHITEDFY